ncbi:MAG TPA: hypothetical protein PK490_19455, partial [Prosthecobacter sp.]|nr:hypothetical protein [Prosthecobacter sp.]
MFRHTNASASGIRQWFCVEAVENSSINGERHFEVVIWRGGSISSNFSLYVHDSKNESGSQTLGAAGGG